MTEIYKKAEKELGEKDRLQKLRKINDYLKNEKLQKFLPKNLKAPTGSESKEQVDSIYLNIQSHFKAKHKELMVNSFFDLAMDWTETGMVAFLGQYDKIGLGDHLRKNKEEIFEPELSECIIELDDSWVPSAQARLVMKFAQTVMAYKNGGNFSNVPKEKEEEKENEQAEVDPAPKRFPERPLHKRGVPPS